MQRAIMTGDSETGVMVMRMESGLDTGPVALAERVAITRRMDAVLSEKAKRGTAERAEASRAAAAQRVSELRSAQPASAEGEGGDETDQARHDQAATELAAAENWAAELTRVAASAKAELEKAEQNLAAAQEVAGKRKQEAGQAARDRNATAQKAADAADSSRQAAAHRAATADQAVRANAEAENATSAYGKTAQAAQEREDDERRAVEQALADAAALQQAREAVNAAETNTARRKDAESAAKARQQTAVARSKDLLAAQEETARRQQDTARRYAAPDDQRDAASPLDPGHPSQGSDETGTRRMPAATVPPAPSDRQLPIEPVLTPYTFNLPLLVNAHHGSTDPIQLAGALVANINQVVGARALGQAELRLEAGAPELIAAGVEAAQSVARQLHHQIVFVLPAGDSEINICP